VSVENGGLPARRAVIRWAVRLFRREWRQQVLMLALLTVSVAMVVGATSAAYSVAPSPERKQGTADWLVHLDRGDAANLATARQVLGTIDVIQRESVPVPGSVEQVELRAQDPNGPYGAPMVSLRSGRYPSASDEITITDGVAKLLDVSVGSSVDLGDRQREVVGTVENPYDLGDEFALAPTSGLGAERRTDLLVGGTLDQVQAFLRSGIRGGIESEGDTRVVTAALTLVPATVVLLLVALVAAAGFAVVAQRRLRQLGMLAAIGATERHLRLVLVANGAVLGVVAGLLGGTIGLVAWLVGAPHLEAAAGHRIDSLDLPWAVIAGGMVLALLTSVAAAWRPGSAVARIPITLALSGRPPRPQAAHRSAALAVVFLVSGVGLLAASDQETPWMIIGGTIGVVLGILFVSPLAIRALVGVGGRAPIAVRLALRDLGRFQARSAAALAAISLALGAPIGIVLIASSATHTATEGNLSDRQVLVRLGNGRQPNVPVVTTADRRRLTAAVDALVASIPGATSIPLQVATSGTTETTEGRAVLPLTDLARPLNANNFRYAGPIYIADAATLRQLGVRGDDTAGVDLLTAERGKVMVINPAVRRFDTPTVARIDMPAYSSAPHTFVTASGQQRLGIVPALSGWFISSAHRLTDDQLAAARDMAVAQGLTIETRNSQAGLSTVRSSATAVGALLALGILAMTVGLIRSEAAGDLRTLAATGASSRVRRTLAAATAGALALLGVALGTVGAYLAMLGAYASDLGMLTQVPIVDLAITIVGVPLLAAGAAWLVAGSEPPVLTRRLLD
jgi:putative ABC transport system permease protein